MGQPICPAALHHAPRFAELLLVQRKAAAWAGPAERLSGTWTDGMHLLGGVEVGVEGLLQRHELSTQCIDLILHTQS